MSQWRNPGPEPLGIFEWVFIAGIAAFAMGSCGWSCYKERIKLDSQKALIEMNERQKDAGTNDR